MRIDIASHHGKYLTITWKSGVKLPPTQGILDAGEAPMLNIGDVKFTSDDVCSYTVGNPADYPYRRL